MASVRFSTRPSAADCKLAVQQRVAAIRKVRDARVL